MFLLKKKYILALGVMLLTFPSGIENVAAASPTGAVKSVTKKISTQAKKAAKSTKTQIKQTIPRKKKRSASGTMAEDPSAKNTSTPHSNDAGVQGKRVVVPVTPFQEIRHQNEKINRSPNALWQKGKLIKWKSLETISVQELSHDDTFKQKIWPELNKWDEDNHVDRIEFLERSFDEFKNYVNNQIQAFYEKAKTIPKKNNKDDARAAGRALFPALMNRLNHTKNALGLSWAHVHGKTTEEKKYTDENDGLQTTAFSDRDTYTEKQRKKFREALDEQYKFIEAEIDSVRKKLTKIILKK